MIQHNGPPIDAVYRHEKDGKTHWSRRPVVAWDEDGTPLVVGEGCSRLVDADFYSAFHSLAEGEPPGQVTPGGGWLVTYEPAEDGDGWTEPVVGWLIDSDGYGKPLTTDGEGTVEPLRPGPRAFTVHHPDHPWGD